jgi:predicted O-methyltransferase YrrM
MALLPPAARSRVPVGLRDDVRLRAAAVGLGLIPPRTMHSPADASALLEAVRGARRVVEIGVYEGASALLLLDELGAGAELHLVDPFGRRPDALPEGWGASEWATRRLLARHARRRANTPEVRWHVDLSADVAAGWREPVDCVFIDGDHSESGCETDWLSWSPFVIAGGHVVFHDARAGGPGGRGLPGPTAVVERYLRGGREDGWEIVAEADATVVARRGGRSSTG